MRIADIRTELNGQEFMLRNAREEEAQMLIDYLKVTNGETNFLLREPEEITMTVEQERAFIARQNESAGNIMLLGFLDGEFVGNCALNGFGPFRCRHRVSMGIALYQKFTGRGIGRVMMENLIRLAKEMGYEQLELEVFANNVRAIALYKKMGFEICATMPNAMKFKDGTYVDEHTMILKLYKKSIIYRN